ncbi:MAG: hypothetical protein EX270_09735 [Pseudomonadales bacterium]|nr:MAG: hypothetical protein EX270_09735 [Pseudomonadales bacterium]
MAARTRRCRNRARRRRIRRDPARQRQRKARKGKNPQTGAEIDIPASSSVGFKPGKSLKDSVN